MRWRWGWKGEWSWDENENEMKDYLTGTRGGERKRRGKEQTPTPTHLAPGAGKPWKGKRREKRRPTDTEQDQRRGGRRKRLNQPNTAKTYAYLGTHRTRPTMGREKNAWNRGANGELKLVNRKKQRLNGIQFFPKESCVTPSRERCQVKPCGHKQLFKFQRIGCTTCSTSPDTKETIPAGKGHAWCLQSHMCSVHVPLQKLRW